MEPRKLTKADLDKVRDIEGFPIGTDEDIIALSDAPYYTACPNPFIEEFIKENGTPYDEETDDYHREPFAADVSEQKNDAIYNAHSYHTKVPYKAIINYLLHYTEPGDIVLDGFCGTGMTGIANLYVLSMLASEAKSAATYCLIGDKIIESLNQEENQTIIVNGMPGSGKTIVAIFLMKYLRDSEEFSNKKIGFVVPQTSLRKTRKGIFKSIYGIKASDILSPSDVTKQNYDILLVNEAHRLHQYKNIS